MNYSMIFLFFVISLTKDISSTYSTMSLRNLQRKVSSGSVDFAIRGAFLSAKLHQVKEIEYKIGARSDRKTNGFLQTFLEGFLGTQTTTIPANSGILEDIFGTKIIFHNVNFYFHCEDDRRSTQFSLIPKYGSDNQMSIWTNKLRITLEVELRRETNEPRSAFGLFTTLHFENFVLNVTRTTEMEFIFDFSYANYFVWHYGVEAKIYWRPIRLDFPIDRENNLTRAITPILPVLLREHINRDPGFSQAIDYIIAKSF